MGKNLPHLNEERAETADTGVSSSQWSNPSPLKVEDRLAQESGEPRNSGILYGRKEGNFVGGG